MIEHRITRRTIVALFVATTAALVARALVQKHLITTGYSSAFASDLSYLVVPPILVALLFPIWKSEIRYIQAQFRRTDLSWPIAIRAMAIGFLVRVAWWSQLFAGISFGVYRTPDATAIKPFTLSFQCPPAIEIGLGLVVMAAIVPLIEETFNRGYIQGALRNRGLVVSILAGATVFTIFHTFSSWPFVFLAGLLFGTQYWIAGSLWPSLITHATINGLIQIDWRCFIGQWSPAAESPDLLLPGVVALTMLVASALTILFLVCGMATGARGALR